MGAWTSAAILDAVPGSDRAARILIGVGVISAVPSAVAGFTDWSELHEQQQRVGLVHAAGNLAATSLYVASLVERSRGRQPRGKLLGYLGFASLAAAGFLGGHLTYRQAAGVNHSEDVPHRFPVGWHALALLDELVEGKLEQRMVAGMPLLVFRRGDAVNVLSDVCSHLSGPLHEGKVEERGEPCVVCPWHGSAFSLRSGEVMGGPATAGQPRFSTRIENGLVEVSLPGAG
ncbi:Rieske 2Fe-2S domain-containing protein [Arthrobacter sp. NPDC056886]|uniref:Rieske 2Fe-2S domain-containing protein n=1 Tax=Arthrobacter sp. NPDC056886 TaxID=3345960 RepID=UPI00366C3B26